MHPSIAKEYGTSHVWRSLIKVREEVENNIWWQLKTGNSIFCFDNWNSQEALFYVENENSNEQELEVRDFGEHGVWNTQKFKSKVSEEMV